MKGKLSIDRVEKLVRDLEVPRAEIFTRLERELKLKPNPKPRTELWFPDDNLPVLGIRVLRSGVATWCIRPSVHGKQERVRIGDVQAMKRKIAVQEANHKIYEMDRKKLYPAEATAEALASRQMTFEVVAADFLKRKREERLRPKTWKKYEDYLTKWYFEPFHKRPIDEIATAEFRDRIEFIKEEAAKATNARNGSATAHACHSLLKLLYKWAALTDRFPDTRANPIDKVQAPVKNDSRERVLTPAEIRHIWKVCDDWEAETLAFAENGTRRAPGGFDLMTDYPRAVKLLLLTGMRSEEMGYLHRSEVTLPQHEGEFGEINLGKHRNKEGRPKRIPLVPTAVEIFRKIYAEHSKRRSDDPCVFGRGDGRRIVLDGVQWKEGLNLDDTVRKILKRVKRGPTGFWKHFRDPEQVKRIRYAIATSPVTGISGNQIMKQEGISNRTLKEIERSMKAGEPIPEAQPAMAHWSIHDLRRTFRTGLSECKVEFRIAEIFLGHKDPLGSKTSEAYDKYKFWEEKCDAATRWEARLLSILESTAPEVSQGTIEAGNQVAQELTT